MKRLGILCTVILVVLLSVASVVGCAEKEEAPTPEPESTQEPTPSLPSVESNVYSNSEYGFSLEYPEDWDVLEDYMGMVFMICGPLVDEYIVNVNLSTEQLDETVTLKDYARMVELTTKRQSLNYEKLDEYSTTIGGQPAIVLVMTCTMEIEGKEYTLKDSGAVLIKDNIAYIITYDVPAELHDEYSNCFELMIDSFEFE